jgi:hypothetical protein
MTIVNVFILGEISPIFNLTNMRSTLKKKKSSQIWLKALGMVGWTKIQQEKTWAKVHFASFIVCTMLTHDDNKIIYIHS